MKTAKSESITHSPEETKNLAKELASRLKPPKLIALFGELGAGKTTFVQGFAEYFGIKAVRSPSFTLINEYKNSVKIYHVDLYRIEDAGELYPAGFFDLIQDKNAFVLVEWPEKIQDVVKFDVMVYIFHLDELSRKIKIQFT